MEKKKVLLILGIILAAVLIFSVYKLTGQITSSVGGRGDCLDTDNGLDYYKRGTASYTKRKSAYTDYCSSQTPFGPKIFVNEYYCADSFTVGSRNHKCEKGCVNGACVK